MAVQNKLQNNVQWESFRLVKLNSGAKSPRFTVQKELFRITLSDFQLNNEE